MKNKTKKPKKLIKKKKSKSKAKRIKREIPKHYPEYDFPEVIINCEVKMNDSTAKAIDSLIVLNKDYWRTYITKNPMTFITYLNQKFDGFYD